MGKRSSFDRVDKDFYPTPPEAVAPLLPHLPSHFTYDEPCAGAGDLVDAFDKLTGGRAVALTVSDIAPRRADIHKKDYRDYIPDPGARFIITNPPWSRDKKSDYILHRMIEIFSALRPTWLLFDADWIHTLQSEKLLPTLVKVVSIGRVKWVPGSAMTGKDNCSWYLFDATHTGGTELYGRNKSISKILKEKNAVICE